MKKNATSRFFLISHGTHVHCAVMMLYTHSIGNQLWNTMVAFKMRDSVLSVRYYGVYNVLRIWRIPLILTYRVYRLYDTKIYINVNSINYN